MKEFSLHWLWRNKISKIASLKSLSEVPIIVHFPGHYNDGPGPDFLNARIQLGGIHLAGNVEIHINSSDWYLHQHHLDGAYNNVLLHVVFFANKQVKMHNGYYLEQLEIRDFFNADELDKAYLDFLKDDSIRCRRFFTQKEAFKASMWLNRMAVNRWQNKILFAENYLFNSGRNFGDLYWKLILNGIAFSLHSKLFNEIYEQFGYKIFQREIGSNSFYSILIEASNLLMVKHDLEVSNEFNYFCFKNNINFRGNIISNYSFRPNNSPKRRISQLSKYASFFNSFRTEISDCKNVEELWSNWQSRINNYAEMKELSKPSKGFMLQLFYNSVLPFYVVFNLAEHKVKRHQEVLRFLDKLVEEKNGIIKKFDFFNLEDSSFLKGQGKLELYKNHCTKNRCLSCGIGNSIFARDSEENQINLSLRHG